jgi:hypothetical protein
VPSSSVQVPSSSVLDTTRRLVGKTGRYTQGPSTSGTCSPAGSRPRDDQRVLVRAADVDAACIAGGIVCAERGVLELMGTRADAERVRTGWERMWR